MKQSSPSMIRRLAALLPKHATQVVLAVAVAGLFVVSAAHAAPTSTLYMIDGIGSGRPSSTLFTLQGGTGTWTSVPLIGWDGSLAVTDTIKTMGVLGRQYTLGGTATGVTYPLTAGTNDGFCDGTSDGVNNYSADTNTGIVWKFNGNWASPSQLFQISDSVPFGITYDKTNNTLWIDMIDSGIMSNYTLTGTLLSSFALADTQGWAYQGLALDPADNTLWVIDGDTATLEQYSKNGVLLSRLVLPTAYKDNGLSLISGMEFAEATPTPIPGALLLFGPGLAGLAFVRRRFGK